MVVSGIVAVGMLQAMEQGTVIGLWWSTRVRVWRGDGRMGNNVPFHKRKWFLAEIIKRRKEIMFSLWKCYIIRGVLTRGPHTRHPVNYILILERLELQNNPVI